MKPQEDIVQNLRDAGCDGDTIDRFLALGKAGKLAGQLHLLDCHRSCLLEKVHREEKRIDCLDYLIYHLEKGG